MVLRPPSRTHHVLTYDLPKIDDVIYDTLTPPTKKNLKNVTDRPFLQTIIKDLSYI